MLRLGNTWLNKALKQNVLITILAMFFRALAAASWVVMSYSLTWLLDGYAAGQALLTRRL